MNDALNGGVMDETLGPSLNVARSWEVSIASFIVALLHKICSLALRCI